MQYCPRCKVKIRGEKACCPLCHGGLATIEGENLPPSFPVLKVSRERTVTKLRVLTFLMVLIEIAAVTTVVMVHQMTGELIRSPFFVMIGVFLAWLDLLIARYYRNNVISLIEVQAIIGMVCCLVIDSFTSGGLSWSVEWVVPAGLVGLEVIAVCVGHGMGMHLVDYGVYLIIDTILGLLQILPIAIHWNPFPVPAILCIALQLSYVAYAVIFRAWDLRNASSKFLNI